MTVSIFRCVAVPALALALACGSFGTAPGGSDAGSDAGAVQDAQDAPDAAASDADCAASAINLVGSDNLVGKVPDGIADYDASAHYFVASQTGTAGCVNVYVEAWPGAGAGILAGVYSDVGGAPQDLRAQARIVRGDVDGGSRRWARVRLNTPMTILKGTGYWLVLYGQAAGFMMQAMIGGCAPGAPAHLMGPASQDMLPSQYKPYRVDGDCNAAIYLSPSR